MKEEPMTDYDIDSNTHSERVASFINLNESTNSSTPDYEQINDSEEKMFREAMRTVDIEILNQQITNINTLNQQLTNLNEKRGSHVWLKVGRVRC